MLILAQNRTVLVNMDRINSIAVHNLGDNKFRILAYYGNENADCWGIGDYETEERAKEILLEIMEKYANVYHTFCIDSSLQPPQSDKTTPISICQTKSAGNRASVRILRVGKDAISALHPFG